jgi:hypothetical protein
MLNISTGHTYRITSITIPNNSKQKDYLKSAPSLNTFRIFCGIVQPSEGIIPVHGITKIRPIERVIP